MVIGKFVRIFQAPLCKGSSAEGGEGLFLQPSNRCAVSEPVSATPASMLRILANPFHHFVVPLPLHRGGIKLCTNFPKTEVSFAYFSFQRKVRSKKSKFVGAEAVNGERLAKEVRLDAGVVFFAYGQLALADEGHRVDIIIQQGGNLR